MRNGQPRDEDLPTSRWRRTRTRIVDIAGGLFARYGVAGTSIEDVRAAAGVSGSQITYYFSSKQGLIRAVIGREADAAINGLGVPGRARFRALEDLYSWAEKAADPQGPACRLGALAGELVQCDPQTQAELALAFERWAFALSRALQGLRSRGLLRPEAEPRSLAYALLAGLHGGVLVSRAVESSTPADGAMRVVLDYITSLRTDSSTDASGDATIPRQP
jgi:TetR/AcrR family transcriptional regulator, transcriptional repressor for nem operon